MKHNPMKRKTRPFPRSRVLSLKAALCLLFLAAANLASADSGTFSNPVLSGFNPDPSVCRVGNDYYLTTSSFTWWPAIPVYHSRDLVHWELISHGIDRPGLIKYEGLNDNDGTWAATIRYNKGMFYIITTGSKCGGNFFIKAANPCGPWSEPVWIENAPGIDSSLLFDDDGRCYYTGNRWDFEKQWPAQCAVWVQEISLETGKLIGERRDIAYGHAANATYAEGPHLYKVNGRYLLLMAEGGSSFNHAVTAHTADNVFGPYTPTTVNPVLTHRHLGRAFPVQNIGHADLVQTQNGEWYAVVLGTRPVDGMTPLGRETFLCKVVFEDGTPIFNPGKGRVLSIQERPQLPECPVNKQPDRLNFSTDSLPSGWYTVRIPQSAPCSVSSGRLVLPLRPQVIDSLTCSSMLLRKVKHHRFTATAAMRFSPRRNGEDAGLTLYRSANGYFTLLKGRRTVTLTCKDKGRKAIIATAPCTAKTVQLRVSVNGSTAQFSFSTDGISWTHLGGTLSLAPIADNMFNKFNGLGIGFYATSNDQKTCSAAEYSWFEYNAE